MKFLLVSSALAAASVFAPAFAQEAPQQASPPTATVETTDEAVAPKPKANVTVETEVDNRSAATVETRKETITPVSDRPKVDSENPIAPEVAAVATSGKKYTTQDIVLAQLEAIKNTPVSEPTTTITTTTTTPGG